MNELKPCPFCGGEGTYYYQPDLERPELKHCHNVCCDRCAATTGIYISKEQAVAAWNRRAQPANEALTLSELYDIDSEPLYFHCMVGHWSLNGWHIVKAINYDGAQFKDVQLDNNDAHIESLYNYGITWLAYRHKPERSEGQ